jgi:hypothetical protein
MKIGRWGEWREMKGKLWKMVLDGCRRVENEEKKRCKGTYEGKAGGYAASGERTLLLET